MSRQETPLILSSIPSLFLKSEIMSKLEGFVPFPAEFAAIYRAKGYWEDRTLGNFFNEVCHRYSERIALVAGKEYITYQELGARTERLALHLLKLGVRPLDRFILQLPNTPEFSYLYFALQKIGAIPVMALPSHRQAEISQFAGLSQAVGYAFPESIGDFNFGELAKLVKQEHSSLRWLVVGGSQSGEQADILAVSSLLVSDSGLKSSELSQLEIDPTDPALFQLSGGTTGISKLIPRTHNGYLYNTKAAAAINDIRPNDRLLVVLPMAHNFPLACPGLQGFLMHGARCVLATSTKTEDIFRLIEQERVTHLELVPTLLIRLMNDPQLANYDLSSVRIINSGGQKLQTEVKILTEQTLPNCKVQEVFGMAEDLLCYVRLDDPPEVRYETVGRPVSPADEIRLLDAAGNEVAEGKLASCMSEGLIPYAVIIRFLSITPALLPRTASTVLAI